MNKNQLKRLRNKKKQKKLRNVIKNNSPKEFDPLCHIRRGTTNNIKCKNYL